ncbi:MAG: FkbM family methyltransferase [Nitrospirota bacterium]|nr:FkbM family methyltransferase [Nitrospirota bacterium]
MKSLNIIVNKILNCMNLHLKILRRNHDTIISELEAFREKYPETIIFDVGAHEGSSINRFRILYGTESTKIYAFEPSSLFVQLKQKYSREPYIILSKYAISDSNGEVEFFEHKSATGSSSLEAVSKGSKFSKRRRLEEESNIAVTKVEKVTVDSFCKDNNIDYISHLKIDVQGHEANVLSGAKQMLSNNLIEIIEVEVITGDAYSKVGSFFGIEQYLIPFGYSIVSISPDGRFFNLEPHDILRNAELQFDLIYCSKKVRERILNVN